MEVIQMRQLTKICRTSSRPLVIRKIVIIFKVKKFFFNWKGNLNNSKRIRSTVTKRTHWSLGHGLQIVHFLAEVSFPLPSDGPRTNVCCWKVGQRVAVYVFRSKVWGWLIACSASGLNPQEPGSRISSTHGFSHGKTGHPFKLRAETKSRISTL